MTPPLYMDMEKARSALCSFTSQFHAFWFFIRGTVMMALGSCFRLMSIMWTFNQRLEPCSVRWELVNHPKQRKQPGQWPALASGPADWTNVGNWDVRNCWMWQITLTGADRSYQQHHEEWLSFTGGSEGVMWEMEKPPWKGALGPWARPTASWCPHQPQDIKVRLSVQ